MKKQAPVTHRGANVNIITQVPREVFEAFTALCEEKGVTRAAMLRSLIIREVGDDRREHHTKA